MMELQGMYYIIFMEGVVCDDEISSTITMPVTTRRASYDDPPSDTAIGEGIQSTLGSAALVDYGFRHSRKNKVICAV